MEPRGFSEAHERQTQATSIEMQPLDDIHIPISRNAFSAPGDGTFKRAVVYDNELASGAGIDDINTRPEANPSFTEGGVENKKQNLSKWDVGSLVLNKMVGGGIFTTPGLVLHLTQSKGLSVGLWALGGVYGASCLIMYLEYGAALPFNGGELIYMNKVWPKPALFSAILFSGFFISLGHTAGNAATFSRHVLIAAMPTPPPTPLDSSPEIHLDGRLVKVFALVILGIVCLLLWVSPKMGLFMNRVLAAYKIVLLLVVGCAGINARHKSNAGSSVNDWKRPDSGFDSVSGLIYIVYSYTGWENANYIIGDIKTKRRDLRLGAFGAIAVVTALYTLLNVGYFLACQSEVITGPQNDIGLAVAFAHQVFGETLGLKICIAISAVGNLLAVAYTSSKVKQAIALQHFIPFSSFFARDDHFTTPGGALLLHWLCSSIVILAMPNSTDGYAFVIGLFTYGQLIVGVALGLGLPRLKAAMGKLPHGVWRPVLSTQWSNWMFGFSLACVNLFLLISAAWPRQPHDIPRFWWPVTLTIIMGVGCVWWAVLALAQTRFGAKIGWKVEVTSVQLDELSKYQRQERRDGAETMAVHKVPEEGPLGKMQNLIGKPLKVVKDQIYEY